ncbi:MAG: hypothetical protein IPP86_08285 [Bacteroidetes bacterium]|nr:hypothetical protein [Bacteroidota bacterium]
MKKQAKHLNSWILGGMDYYPFGMGMDNRSYLAGKGRRFGFNGQEKDDELKGSGNSLEFKFRIYDPRLEDF